MQVEQSVATASRTDPTKFDIMMETFGGGSYLNATLKRFWTGDNEKEYKGLNIMLVEDKKLDELFLALDKDNSAANIKAWDDWFPYEQCYAYGICCYYDQTACRSYIEPALGTRYVLCPNASRPK